MYTTIEGIKIKVTEMTKSFLVNSIKRLEAVCTAKNIDPESLKILKEEKEELKTELNFRLKRKFKVIVENEKEDDLI